MANKGPFEVGFGKPPRSTRFKPGQSGNPNGRPRGAKNFAIAIGQELDSRVTVTENGRRRRISKREVIAKHLVNKAVSGDLKAIPLLLMYRGSAWRLLPIPKCRWSGLISPLLILYATTHQIGLSGPILVTTVVGLAIFLVAVLLSPETKGKVLVADLTVA